MILGIDELQELESDLKFELDNRLTEILTTLNRNNKLEDFLSLIGLKNLLIQTSVYQVYKTGKIIIIGQSEISKEVILSIGKKLGISKDRFELYLEYEDAKRFNFKKTQYAPSYSLIMAGPIPHSGVDKGDYSSILSSIENEQGYPPLIRLGTSGLKITKTDLKNKLKEAVERNFIEAG